MALTLLYTNSVLNGQTILGVAQTAPFSGWSYSNFLCSVLPFFLVALLLYCNQLFLKKEAAARTIILTTPISIKQYYTVRSLAILFSYIIFCCLTILYSFYFYGSVFHFYHFTDFLYPIFLVLVAPAIFFYSLGLLIGRYHNQLLYILAVIVFTLGMLPPFNHSGALLCKLFMNSYPYSIAVNSFGERPFEIPLDFLISRFLWIGFGITLYILALNQLNKKIERN
jgi:hypothetical protein